MKVIVSHPGKQYVHQLVFALQKKKSLVVFYTTIWDIKHKKLIKRIKFFFPFTRDAFNKRSFLPLDTDQIKINLFPELLRMALNKLFPRKLNNWVFLIDRLHDKYISKKIKSVDFDIFIGFENASKLSFKEAKQRGKITILDLAQVHHFTIEDLRQNYPHFRRVIGDEKFSEQMTRHKEDQNKYVDFFFVLSEFAKSTLLKAGIAGDKIYQLTLGFDPSKFSLKPSFNHKNFTILFVGTVTRRKGIHLVMEAFNQLNLNGCKLQIVGPMADASDLLQDLPVNVEYFPFLEHDQLVRYYQNADVFVFPSYLDSWAMVVIEAMACGTPVIISENTGSKDAVKKGGGFIIPVDDINAVKEKILLLYKNREMIESMGRKAHEIVNEYTWDNYHLQIQSAIEDIARKSDLQ